MELMRSADGLLVLLSDLPEAGRVVPAKIFESMAAKRRILSITPRGEMWELTAAHPAIDRHEPSDIAGICESLANAIERKLRGEAVHFDFDASRFDRRMLAGEFARVLDSCVNVPSRELLREAEECHALC